MTELDDRLRDAAHDPFSARALVYCLLLSPDAEVRQRQIESLRQKAHPVTFGMVETFAEAVNLLAKPLHLPLLELCLPALKALSAPQYQVFKRNLGLLIKADAKVDLFEWALYRIVTHQLEPRRPTGPTHTLKHQGSAAGLLLSMLAHCGHRQREQALQAFSAAAYTLNLPQLALLDKQQLQLPALDRALDSLNQLKPLQKPLLLKAMARCVTHDGNVTPTEAELFRAIADSLDCPVPPLLPGQKLA